ncbi:hypothetical protein GIB67_027089 [Kingdonia uniflora]|uniref:Uncharacterized protein n=1 Tax=Kingdonia uniflora TaxID=39325 RepID=A0A7J7P2J7_9MAGN|nr:hypothetical protein GIB67_027089 [Kingdonia uniflora]
MQSIFVRPSTRAVVRHSMYLPRQARSVEFHVRCMSKVSTKFTDVLAFSGPAPERINGRLAMIGFVAALGVELARGDDLLTQLGNGGVPWFIGDDCVIVVGIVDSLV